MTTNTPSKTSSSLNEKLLNQFKIERQRSDEFFGIADEASYYTAPIYLRHPLVFYDGHVDAFNWNVLFRKILKRPSFNPQFDALFARGIDPSSSDHAQRLKIEHWPSRDKVKAYKEEINRQFYDYLSQVDFSKAEHPLLKNGTIFFLLLEHELTHQETLLYMIHQLPHTNKNRLYSPEKIKTSIPVTSPQFIPSMKTIPAGKTYLGAEAGEFDFGWDNEFEGQWHELEAFEIDTYPVTNGEFLNFMEAGGYENKAWWTEKTWAWLQENTENNQKQKHPHYWFKQNNQWFFRGLFEDIKLPLSWSAYVTHAEAKAYAKFSGKSLPTEAQWHRAAYGESSSIVYPWGTKTPNESLANANYTSWSPSPVNKHPQGASPFGIHDLLGNAWEWTATPFAPFKGFEASEGYPQYSADFFDGEHFVMKGGSFATHQRLLRRPFRNWFYWDYPYMYTGFRCVKNA